AALVDEAAVALGDLAALDAEGPRRRGRFERRGGDIGAGLGQCLLIGIHGVHGAGHVLGGNFGSGLLVGIEHKQELHGSRPFWLRDSIALQGNVGRGPVISTGRAEYSGAALPPGFRFWSRRSRSTTRGEVRLEMPVDRQGSG